MRKVILPKHFIRVAAANEMSSAVFALKYADALMVSQPFALKTRKSLGASIEAYNKPFLIDPETYRYFFISKRHYKQKKIRAWLNEMAQIMPEEIKQSFGKRRAETSNFDAVQMLEFCQSNIEIQTCLQSTSGTPLLPLAIMCPYALIEENDFSSKLQFHVQIIKTMLKVNTTELPVVGCIYLSSDLLLRPARLTRIVEMLSNVDCHGIAVWIEGFDETKVDVEELENLKDFYGELAQTKHVIAMYGGTAQIMMMYSNLGSVTNGVHYQMSKSGIAEGGGPAHFFYVPNLRQRVRTIEAAAIISRQNFDRIDYLEKICNCPVCQHEVSYDPAKVIYSLEGNAGDQVEKLTTHFSYNKLLEIRNTQVLTKQEYASWIVNTAVLLSLSEDEDEYIETIKRWTEAVLGVNFDEDEDEEVV